MKLAIAIAFLFIGLVHSATISTESLDALKPKPALSTVDSIETSVPFATVTETKQKREALTKNAESLETTKTTESDARLTVDAVDTSKRSFGNMMSMDIPDGMNASQCIYKPEENTLTCKSPSETIECATTLVAGSLNATATHVYGIAAVPCTDAKCSLETTKFWLFPRNIDNATTYRNRTALNGTIELQLWSGEAASNVRGLNITDLTCYTKLAKTITEGCKTPRMVRVTSNWTNTVEEVGLCGEILVLDKTMQKRWLYGYGWGLGGLGSLWGWGGYPYLGYWWGK